MLCPGCKASIADTSKFCPECGQRLVTAAKPGGDTATDAERRHITVLFCDLVGSLELSRKLDPEDLRELVRGYQRACADIVERFDGHIAQYLGDGILVYFGYPRAHEDDAARAIHSGLAIVDGVKKLGAEWSHSHGIDVRVRVGIHTGLTVIGDVGSGARREQLATGEAPNIAARLQGVAEPGTVVISDSTQRLVRGYFRCESLGTRTLSGVAGPMEITRVMAPTGADTRLGAAAEGGLTHFVGRRRELEFLLERWVRVQSGAAQIVLIRGEAGIGKSRQLLELRESLVRDDPAVLEAQCSAYHTVSAFHPIIEMIDGRLGLAAARTNEERFERLRVGLSSAGIHDAESLALLAALHGVAMPVGTPPLKITPQRQRRRTIEVLRSLIVGTAQLMPTLLIVEDLHWADPSTLDTLDDLIAVAHDAKLLVVMTFRPDFAPPWPVVDNVVELNLARLSDSEAEHLIGGITVEMHLPAAVIRRIVSRADGNPLFAEEMTKAVLEAARLESEQELSSSLAETLIPATLQDSLIARLDRLGPSKTVAQLAAAVGREFSFELLHAVAAIPEAELTASLARLVDAELLQAGERHPSPRYRFKHALIQDAAYQSLLRARRQEIHERIAQVLADRFPEHVAANPEVAAHHLTVAGKTAQAVPLWIKAGQLASQRSANQEAEAHLRRALDLARALPEGAERVQAELTVEIMLGPILMATKGYAHPEVEATYRRARDICAAIGETPQVVPVLFGLWAYYVVGGQLKTARSLGEQILRLVPALGDSGLVLEAHVVLGVTLYFLGELEEAREQLESAIEVYDPSQHRVHAMIFGQEPGMASHIYLAKTLCLLNDAEGAERHRAEAARIARETEHPHTSAFYMMYDAVVQQFFGRANETASLTDRLMALSEEQGFPIWHSGAEVLKGWALAASGQRREGIALMTDGIAHWKATGTTLYTPYWLSLLALAEADAGQRDAALRRIDDAIELEKSGEERLALTLLQRARARIQADLKPADVPAVH